MQGRRRNSLSHARAESSSSCAPRKNPPALSRAHAEARRSEYNAVRGRLLPRARGEDGSPSCTAVGSLPPVSLTRSAPLRRKKSPVSHPRRSLGSRDVLFESAHDVPCRKRFFCRKRSSHTTTSPAEFSTGDVWKRHSALQKRRARRLVKETLPFRGDFDILRYGVDEAAVSVVQPLVKNVQKQLS